MPDQHGAAPAGAAGVVAVVRAFAADRAAVAIAIAAIPAAAAFGKLAPAAVVDPDAAVVGTPVAAFHTAGVGELPDQHGAAPAGAAGPAAVVGAFAADGLAIAVVVAVPPAVAGGGGEAAPATVVHPDVAVAAAPVAAFHAAGVGEVLHQCGAAAEGRGALLAAVVVAGAGDGAVVPARLRGGGQYGQRQRRGGQQGGEDGVACRRHGASSLCGW